METVIKNRMLEKRVLFSTYQNQNIVVYALYDIQQKLFAVVAIHFLYEDVLAPFNEYENLFHELLYSELTEPYLDWYENIDIAIQKNFEDFL